jgi:hypothetical protein
MVRVRFTSNNQKMKGFIQNSFSILRVFWALVFTSFLVADCMGQTTSEWVGFIDFAEAVAEYNETKPKDDPHKAIVLIGDIRVEQQVNVENQERKLFLHIPGKEINRKYGFQYEIDKGEIDMPEIIKNGRTVFLGDNLVVQDFQAKRNYLFIIEGYENRVPALEPTMHGIGILSSFSRN